jgi:phosphoribosyl 1,2-cyclic phosphate phosphodiesterase
MGVNPQKLVVTVLGSGTSAGVPMIGCHCAVCSSTDPRDQRTRPSIAVSYEGDGKQTVLVDTSPELRLQAVRNRLDRVDAVVYTHAHADHIFGLDDVRRYNTLMGTALPMYATKETFAALRGAFGYAFREKEGAAAGTKDSLYRPELLPREIEEGKAFEVCGREWIPVPLVHGRFRVLGFRVGNFAYCTDCNEIPPTSMKLLEGLDVLIIDALRPKPHPTHLSFVQALSVIEQLQPKRAFFTHLSHDVGHVEIEAGLPAQVRVAYDGLKIVIE